MSTIAFPAAWGQLTIKIRSARTEYDDTGTPITMLIQGEAIDASTPPAVRGHVGVVYTYATGALIQMNGVPILTDSGAQQTTILNSANLGPTILAAAVAASAKDIIT